MRETCKYPNIKFYTQIKYLSGVSVENFLNFIDSITYLDSCAETDSIAKNFWSNQSQESSRVQANEEDQAVCVSKSHCVIYDLLLQMTFSFRLTGDTLPRDVCHQEDQIMFTTVRVILNQGPPQTLEHGCNYSEQSHSSETMKARAMPPSPKTFSTSLVLPKEPEILGLELTREGTGCSMTQVHLAKYKAYLRDIVDSVLDYCNIPTFPLW